MLISTKADLKELEAEPDIDKFILTELNYFQVFLILVYKLIFILYESYTKLSEKIATHLITLWRPADMITKKFNTFKKEALKFKV